MKPSFQVTVGKFTVLPEIAGAWRSDDLRGLLESLDFDDVSEVGDADLREMCLLALQELAPDDAATVVLKYRFGNRLTDGKIQNSGQQMLDEKLWEEGADMSLHEDFFSVASLLYAANSPAFPEPDAVELSIQIAANNDAAIEIMRHDLHESFLVRLLADGMDENSVLHRLFDDQLAGKTFPEASSIVWIVKIDAKADKAASLSVISSGYWLDPLRHISSYTSEAYPDEAAHD